MRLKADGRWNGMGLDSRKRTMTGAAEQHRVLLHKDAIMKDCHAAKNGVRRREPRGRQGDIKGLPLPGCTRCIDQWRMLPIDGPCHAIRIDGVRFEGVKDLNLILIQ